MRLQVGHCCNNNSVVVPYVKNCMQDGPHFIIQAVLQGNVGGQGSMIKRVAEIGNPCL